MVYAGNEGYLDEIPADQVQAFENTFLPYLRSTHPEVLDTIRESKDLSKQTQANLEGILKDSVASFVAGKAPDPRSAEKKG